MKKITILFSCLILSACSLAPTYQRPTVPQPVKYKESGKWLRANPISATLDRGPWWQKYHDPVLNSLEQKVVCDNQNIKAAFARYQEAQATLGIAKAGYFPTVTGIANVNRQKSSSNSPNPANNRMFNDFLAGMNLNYEVDLWGRVRNSVVAADNQMHASAADLAAISLSMQTDLAAFYFSLRGADAQQRILDETVTAYKMALDLTSNRFKGGADSELSLDEAKNQYETARTLAADMRLQRARFEHAIAVLIGAAPADFTLKPVRSKSTFVTISPYLPSVLLERRPDIAEAEYQVQAANARIGVARAAYFPAFNLSTAIGFESATLGNLLKSSSFVWALGPTTATALLNNGTVPGLTQVIIDGGRIANITQAAWAEYNQTVANYRQTTLTAYQEVEDNLAAIRELDQEYRTQNAATQAAGRALTQSMYRYKGGLVTYLDVVVIQNIALQARLSDINIHTRRQLASVQLIKALGGGWDKSHS